LFDCLISARISIGDTTRKTLTKTEQKHLPEADLAEKPTPYLAAEIIWDRRRKIFRQKVFIGDRFTL
jgi:hypothetical protein